MNVWRGSCILYKLSSRQQHCNAGLQLMVCMVCNILRTWSEVVASSSLPVWGWGACRTTKYILIAVFKCLVLNGWFLGVSTDKIMLSGALYRSANLKNWVFKSSLFWFLQNWPIFGLQVHVRGAPVLYGTVLDHSLPFTVILLDYVVGS